MKRELNLGTVLAGAVVNELQRIGDALSAPMQARAVLVSPEEADGEALAQVELYPGGGHTPEVFEVVVREKRRKPVGYLTPELRYLRAMVEVGMERVQSMDAPGLARWVKAAAIALQETSRLKQPLSEPPETREALLLRAALLAESFGQSGGLVYVHDEADAGPRWVILSPGRLTRIYEAMFGGEVPEGDVEWQHLHVERGEDEPGADDGG